MRFAGTGIYVATGGLGMAVNASNEQDVMLFERLAFLSRREGR